MVGSPSSLFSLDLSDGDHHAEPLSPVASLTPPPIPGLHLLPAPLPPHLASLLLAQIAQRDLFLGGQRDQVMLFGDEALEWCSEGLRKVKAWGDALVGGWEGRRVWDACWQGNGRARQAILNLYTPGKGIKPHVDLPNRYAEPILSISLLAGTVFLLRRRRPPSSNSVGHPASPPSAGLEETGTAAAASEDDGDETSQWETHRFYLPENSILLLSGEARYGYEHGIEPLLFDRVARPCHPQGDDEERLDEESEWRGRATRVSLTLRWLVEGGEVVGPS